MPVKPNLFIVGQPKSGTSALFSFLKQHPEIEACTVKEPQFFCKDLRSQHFVLSKTERTLENYLALFDESDSTYAMEGSTAYLYSDVAAKEISEFNPQAKIIIMLREPVDFLYTYHKQLLRNSCKFEVVEDFLTALDLEPSRRKGVDLPKNVFDSKFLMYSDRVKYVDHLQRFENYFPDQQIKVILYDDFKNDNAGVFSDVLVFLGFESSFKAEFSVVNKQVQVRSRRIKQFLDKTLFPLKAVIKKYFSKTLFKRLREGYRKLIFSQSDIPKLDESVKADLKHRYREEVALLSEKLSRDLLTEWQYPENVKK